MNGTPRIKSWSIYGRLKPANLPSYVRRINDEDTPLLPIFDDAAWMNTRYQAERKATQHPE